MSKTAQTKSRNSQASETQNHLPRKNAKQRRIDTQRSKHINKMFWALITSNQNQIKSNSIDTINEIKNKLDREVIIAENKVNIKQVDDEATENVREFNLPTPAELTSKGFGKPSIDHSFTQEAAGETMLFHFLKLRTCFLAAIDLANLLATRPLIAHLYKMMQWYKSLNFLKLREYYLDYATQKEISREKVKMFMACRFHYDLSIANTPCIMLGTITQADTETPKQV